MGFDVDDKIIIGRVTDIATIITFHGGFVPEFEAAFKQQWAAKSSPVDNLGKPQKNRPAAG